MNPACLKTLMLRLLMKNPGNKGRNFLLIGSFLVLLGIVVFFVWTYIFVPYRKLSDSSWLNTHSHQEVWSETQKKIKRFGWTHDDFLYVGK